MEFQLHLIVSVLLHSLKSLLDAGCSGRTALSISTNSSLFALFFGYSGFLPSGQFPFFWLKEWMVKCVILLMILIFSSCWGEGVEQRNNKCEIS